MRRYGRRVWWLHSRRPLAVDDCHANAGSSRCPDRIREHADPHIHVDSNGNIHQHTEPYDCPTSHRYTYLGANADSYTHYYLNTDKRADTNCDSYANGDTNTDCDLHANCNTSSVWPC